MPLSPSLGPIGAVGQSFLSVQAACQSNGRDYCFGKDTGRHSHAGLESTTCLGLEGFPAAGDILFFLLSVCPSCASYSPHSSPTGEYYTQYSAIVK